MALLSSGLGLGGELGLRLLLSPGSSSILVRSACGIVGIGMPVYCTYKVLERKGTSGEDEAERNHWLTYWAVCGCLSVAESSCERWLSWLPLYYHLKLAFLIWLQVPPSNSGARVLYMRLLRPLLRRHQGRMDRLVTGTRAHLSHFVAAHQSELAYAAQLLRRVALAALRFGQDSYQALKEPDASPEPSPQPSPPATPTLLDATSDSDPAPTAADSSLHSIRPDQPHTGPQRVTRRIPTETPPFCDSGRRRSPTNSPPYRGANASPLRSDVRTPPGPNTFPSGSPSMHQHNIYETRYVRSLRTMYSTEEPAEDDNPMKRGW
ncbi:hypothetical protein KFL_003770110 [Klebsormidium nitens]|uniref:HVA22-like protein n=1 Tax=Klebsormidium nitens TaxID=105231 RepID=A0A1Y1IFE3_KLENI|nr:hypothetical protein KFL_003770110 [Klebsormidium nitens]|eukprot:GAQ87791.1 hypothetical protein KFL_003770110 [Klebsormidium nitens]